MSEKLEAKLDYHDRTAAGKNYIGITGATSKHEVVGCLKAFERSGIDMNTTHIPMIGYLVSYKTLEFGYNPGDKRYPPLRDLADLIETSRGKAFNTIHYNTKDVGNLYYELSSVLEKDNIYKDNPGLGVQLNVTWPPKDSIRKLKENYPSLMIILSATRKAMQNLRPYQTADRIMRDYSGSDYVILDPSGGRGVSLKIEELGIIYNELKSSGFGGNICFAGGLSGDNVGDAVTKIRRLLSTDAFSIDAQGRLRDGLIDAADNTVLNMDKVNAYTLGAAKGFRR